MKESVIIKPGLILTIESDKYRILGSKEGTVALCQVDVPKLHLKWVKDDDIFNNVSKGKWSLTESEAGYALDVSRLSDEIKSKYDRDCRVMHSVQMYYGPLYNRLKRDRTNHYAANLIKDNNYNPAIFWKLVLRYLQSGFDDTSLIDKRSVRYAVDHYVTVNGKVRKVYDENHQHLSDTDLSNMKKYFEAYKSNRYMSYHDAYTDMLNACYRKKTVEGDTTSYGHLEDSPSEQQFLRYCHSQLTPEQEDQIIMKKQELKNDKRLLKSSSMTNVAYAGQVVEVDEFDSSVSLVSESDPSITVGRANVYMMIDVLSRVILAVGVAFNQNAYIGLSNMLINLAEDKVAYCARYGLTISPEVWPSSIIPERIRTDRGADFKGEDFKKVCLRVGMERNLEPPATGSMKGIIENSFKNIQIDERSLFEKYGLITKDYDSDHHRQAMLNINQYTKVLLLLIIKHNQRAMVKYPMSADMIREGIKPIPYVLWDYFCRNVQSPMLIRNRNDFLMKLMKDGKATIDRKGIHYLQRTYFPVETDAVLENQMYEQQNKKASIDVKYDPRLMDDIYVLRNGKLIVLRMSKDKPENNGFFGLSEQGVIDLNAKHRAIVRESEHHNDQVDADVRLYAQTAIADAHTDLLPSAKDLRKNRHEEKIVVAQENYGIADKLGINNADTVSSTPTVTDSKVNEPAPDQTAFDEAAVLQQFIDKQGK